MSAVIPRLRIGHAGLVEPEVVELGAASDGEQHVIDALDRATVGEVCRVPSKRSIDVAVNTSTPSSRSAASIVDDTSGSSLGISRSCSSTIATSAPRSPNAVAISSEIAPPPINTIFDGTRVQFEQVLVREQAVGVEPVDRELDRSGTGTHDHVLGAHLGHHPVLTGDFDDMGCSATREARPPASRWIVS